MTIADHRPLELRAALIGQRWHLRWNAAVSAWTDPFGVCGRSGERHAAVSLLIEWELLEPDRVLIEAVLEHSGPRTPIFERAVVPARVCGADGLVHVDAELDGRRLLAVSMDAASDRLLYAGTSLITSASLPVGAFDPPTVVRIRRARNVASA